MTEAEKAADEYAEKLWNTGNPRDWAWSDTRKDFLAGFLAGVAWQRGRDVEAVQACAKRLEDGGSIGTAQGAFIAAGAILRESATALQKPDETPSEKAEKAYQRGQRNLALNEELKKQGLVATTEVGKWRPTEEEKNAYRKAFRKALMEAPRCLKHGFPLCGATECSEKDSPRG